MFEKVTSYYGSRVARALGGTQKYLQNENNWNMPHHQNHIVNDGKIQRKAWDPFPSLTLWPPVIPPANFFLRQLITKRQLWYLLCMPRGIHVSRTFI